MKKTTLITAAALLWGINMGASDTMVGNNYTHKPHNQTEANLIASYTTSNKIMTISGIISGYGHRGHGLKIDTGTDIITVNGFGPHKIWHYNNINHPPMGEEVTMETTKIIFSDGSTKTIALNMTINGMVVDLYATTQDIGLFTTPSIFT